MKPHLKVPRKASRKFHKGVYYASNFPAVLSVHLWCVFMSAFWNYVSNRGRFFLIKNFGCTQHSSSKLGSVFAGTKFLLFLHFVSARNAWTAVLLFSIHHTIFYMFKRHVLTQISQIYADKRQAGKWNYNYNNGRSRVSRGNKIQKLRKFLASKSKTKLAWAMPNAARHSLSKKIAKSWTEEACLLCRTQPKLFIKKAHYCSCNVWKDQETHLKVPRKASMKVTDKPWV